MLSIQNNRSDKLPSSISQTSWKIDMQHFILLKIYTVILKLDLLATQNEKKFFCQKMRCNIFPSQRRYQIMMFAPWKRFLLHTWFSLFVNKPQLVCVSHWLSSIPSPYVTVETNFGISIYIFIYTHTLLLFVTLHYLYCKQDNMKYGGIMP